MKNTWKRSSPNSIGPKSRRKTAHFFHGRKPRKWSRFISSPMKKIHEEVKRSLHNMRICGIANQASKLSRAKQSLPKSGNIVESKPIIRGDQPPPLLKSDGKSNHSQAMPQHMNQRIKQNVSRSGNIVQSKPIIRSEHPPPLVRSDDKSNHSRVVPHHMNHQTKQSLSKNGNVVQSIPIIRSEHPTPLVKSDGKSNHSRDMPQHMNQDHTSKDDGVVNAPLGELDKALTLSPKSNPNGSLRPMALARQSQSSTNNLNCTKQSYLQANQMKAMPGLIHNTKDRSNIGQGATKRKHSEIGLHGSNGETSDQNLRNEGGSTQLVHNERWLYGCIGGTNDGNLRCEPLAKPEVPSDIDLNMPKKRRKYIETYDDDDDMGHQSNEGDDTRLPSHNTTTKDCHAKVSSSSISKSVAHHDYWSKPIDKSTWSGIFKVDSKEFVSLSGHLSSKSCDRVWNLSKLLGRVVEVTKVCRSEVWPKRWEASNPTSDNIGLYFFPYKMRPDNHLNRLLTEVMDNDLALRAVMVDAEMLIFPSSLLPEQYQTFQSKHYLWAIFRPRVAEGKHVDESRDEDNSTEAAAAATDATTTVPTVAANAAAKSTEANHNQIDSSMGAEPGRVVSFFVRQTPRVEQLIKEMKREGALIVAMQGEMIAGDGSLLDRRWHGEHSAASRSSS